MYFILRREGMATYPFKKPRYVGPEEDNVQPASKRARVETTPTETGM